MPTTTLDAIALSTGVRLPYAEQGDPDARAVLLLHGFTDSWRAWEPVLEHLPGDVRAIALTQRGHGAAERPSAGYRIRDFARDAAAAIEALGLDRPVAVGHSMGAWVAECLAADTPDTVGGLVLAGAMGPAHANPLVRESTSRATRPACAPGPW